MPPISPLSTFPPAPTGAGKAPSNVLDKDGFMRLLVGQLRQQDPMAATGTEELMAQMTQLSMLEQVTNLTKTNEGLTRTVETTQALSLLGKTVTFVRPDGTSGEGTVDSVAFTDGAATLTIGADAGITPADVVAVK